nr:site-specific DNA-methyltransferase [Legionella maioricensis]
MKMQTLDITDDNIEKIAAIFPNCITETKKNGGVVRAIDFDQLKQELSKSPIVDGIQERYQLNWPGKHEALILANIPTSKTLRPCREESVDFDNTKNLFIEGDNLDALKLLQASYISKIKMIYIDPPYNTGKDFVYVDNFSLKEKEYCLNSGQVNEIGSRMILNTETNGRFHSDWLSMMYPRLKLARNLLRDDGVIFISIDDNEVNNLKSLCDEIFGNENFINQISVKSKPTAGASGGGEDIRLKKNIEYLLCYCKSKLQFEKFNDVFEKKNLFSYIKEYQEEEKSWKYTRILLSLGEKEFFSEIYDGAGKPIKIYKHDDVQIATISDLSKKEGLPEEDIYIKYFDKIFRDTNAQSSIRERVINATDRNNTFYSIEYIPISGKNKNIKTTLYYRGKNKDLIAWLHDVAEKENGTIVKKNKIGTLWDDFNWNNVSKEGDIQFPNGKKPIAFIQRMLTLCTNPDEEEIILDFFAGSSSTAHAVMQLNMEDGGNRKFIMVQLPERCNEKSDLFKLGYTNIAEISRQRIRSAGKIIQSEYIDKKKGRLIDLGFRSLKINDSNLKEVYHQPMKLTQSELSDQINNIKINRTPEDLLFQVLVDWGIDLTLPIMQKVIYNKEVFFIETGNTNTLIVCVETCISEELVKSLAAYKPEKIVFRDGGFRTDSFKINVEQIFKHLSPETEIRIL